MKMSVTIESDSVSVLIVPESEPEKRLLNIFDGAHSIRCRVTRGAYHHSEGIESATILHGWLTCAGSINAGISTPITPNELA